MKRVLYFALAMLLAIVLVSASPSAVLASEEDGTHAMEIEVNGYHVTLDSQNEWKKGENTLIVTLTDSMGMPVEDAEVEILLAPKADDHAEAESAHGAEEPHDSAPEVESAHGSEQGHGSAPAVDSEESHDTMEMSGHGEEMSDHAAETATMIAMLETDEHGMYTANAHFESAGEHEVQVLFHVNGEMLQADFVVEIPGTNSKVFVLWGFVAVNLLLITSAGILKKQTLSVKGVR